MKRKSNRFDDFAVSACVTNAILLSMTPFWYYTDIPGTTLLWYTICGYATIFLGIRTVRRISAIRRKPKIKYPVEITYYSGKRYNGGCRLGYVSPETICAAARTEVKPKNDHRRM